MQASLAKLASYLAANQINGPCIQLHFPHYDGLDKVAQTQYLQALAPYLPAGTYEIAANEVLNTSHKQSSSGLLNDLGGPGVTGYDGLIALIKLERRCLPGVLLGMNEFNVCSFDTGVPPNTYNLQEAINVYKLLADNGAALDWLGCEGYWGGSQGSPAQYKAAIDNVGSQLVTTKGTGAPNTIAFTEFTPGSGKGNVGTTQQAIWQAYLSMFAADPYVFGVTGPWAGFRRSAAFSDESWFYDSTNRGGTDPDGAATSNDHFPASLTWLQGWVASNVGTTPTP
jgi:hypothetical protein